MATKPKMKRKVVGSVLKDKDDPTKSYIRVYGDHVLVDGQILRLETKSEQLDSLERAMKDGKLSGDVGEEIRERLNKIPEYVRFQIIALQSGDNYPL